MFELCLTYKFLIVLLAGASTPVYLHLSVLLLLTPNKRTLLGGVVLVSGRRGPFQGQCLR